MKTAWDYITGSGGWLLLVFLIIFAVLFFNYLFKKVLDRIYHRLEATENPWDDAIIDAIRKPLRYTVWILGIGYAAQVFAKNLIANLDARTEFLKTISAIEDVGIVFVIGWFLIRMAKRVEANIISERQKRGKDLDHTTLEAVGKLARVSIIILTVLVILQTLGFSISGVLAFGGVGGIAVGFAARDLLANFFGAMMIYMDRPFQVGDWVRSPDRNIEGTVESIGWRLTRIRTFDKRPLYVPNSVFTNIAVENPSRMLNRRIYETIGVRYDDATRVGDIVDRVKQMLLEHDEIDHRQTMIVNFNKFASSSLDFFVYTFTKTTNWIKYHEVKQDVMLRIIDIVEEAGAEFAFPTSTVHVPDEINLAMSGATVETKTASTAKKKTQSKKKTGKKKAVAKKATTSKSKTNEPERRGPDDDADGGDGGGE